MCSEYKFEVFAWRDGKRGARPLYVGAVLFYYSALFFLSITSLWGRGGGCLVLSWCHGRQRVCRLMGVALVCNAWTSERVVQHSVLHFGDECWGDGKRIVRPSGHVIFSCICPYTGCMFLFYYLCGETWGERKGGWGGGAWNKSYVTFF